MLALVNEPISVIKHSNVKKYKYSPVFLFNKNLKIQQYLKLSEGIPF